MANSFANTTQYQDLYNSLEVLFYGPETERELYRLGIFSRVDVDVAPRSDPSGSRDVVVRLEEGRLVLKLLPAPELEGDLTHWHLDTFEIQWRKKFPWFGKGKVQFLLDMDGKVTEFRMDVPNDDFWFHELEFKRRR